MPIKAGMLVEFMQDNVPTLGCVLEDQGGKLRLLLANRREVNLTQARILPWQGPQIHAKAKEDIVSALQTHKENRQKIQERIDIMELWEMTQGEVTEENAEFFAGLTENEISPDTAAAYAHAMLEAKSHFKFQNPLFEVYSKETVEAKLAAEKLQKERTMLVSGGAEWFRHLWDLYLKHHTVTEKDLEKEPPEPVAGTLKNLLMKHLAETESHEENLLWKQVTKQVPDETYLAYLLAVTWKIIPEHYNFWLLRADYDDTENYASDYRREIEEMMGLAKEIAKLSSETVQEVPELPAQADGFKNAVHCSLQDAQTMCSVFGKALDKTFVSIDSASTRDIDDAFSFELKENGEKEICIALACPAFFWQFGSDFDKVISKRSTSIYLPEKSLHMMPENLSTDSYSLLEKEVKPSMVVKAVYDAENRLIDSEIGFVRITVEDNLQYLACENFLEDDKSSDEEGLSMEELLKMQTAPSSCACAESAAEVGAEHLAKAEKHKKMLNEAYAFAKDHLEKRIQNGAVIIERDEYSVTLEGEGQHTKVHIDLIPPSPKAQLLVSEFMIIANAIAAEYAAANGFSLFFRTQNIGMPKEMAGIWRRPEEIAKVARLLSPAVTETEPKPHTGLGLKAYSPVTSPLRRYGDLINQAQLMHWHFFRTPMWEKEEMDAMLTQYNIHNGQAGLVQRNRPRYWRFVFMQQEAKRSGEKCCFHGIISDENDMYVTVTLTREQVLVRAKRSLFGDKALLGQEVMLRLGKINPLLFEVSIMKVEEI